MGDWQSIETAPKDGSIILLFSPEYGALYERYSAGLWEDMSYGSGVPGDGFWLHNLEGEPTHWAPVTPPEEHRIVGYDQPSDP